jgi:membrane protein
MQAFLTVVRQSFRTAYDHALPRMGAAIAFYTLFAMAPMLLVVISLASLVLEQDMAREQVTSFAERLGGPRAAETVSTALSNASFTMPGGPEAVIGALAFFFGATAAFNSLLKALNRIWSVDIQTESSIWRYVRRRLLSFLLVLAVALVALLSFMATSVLSGLRSQVPEVVANLPLVNTLSNALLILIPLSLLFATIYRVVPDAKLGWLDVGIGGVLTALLFAAGALAIGHYVGTSSVGSVFGAASSVVLTLVWVYWTAQIVLFGAVVTHTISDYRRGRLDTAPAAA